MEFRICKLLTFRARMWHRATSFRVAAKRRYTITDGIDMVTGHKQAQREANNATKKLRKSFFNLAVEAGDNLLNALNDKLVPQRPNPLKEIELDGVKYVLQQVDGHNCVYVKQEQYNQENYKDNPISNYDRIKDEIITMRELQMRSVMASTPAEIEE